MGIDISTNDAKIRTHVSRTIVVEEAGDSCRKNTHPRRISVLRATKGSSRNAIVLSLKECLSDWIISFMWERLL